MIVDAIWCAIRGESLITKEQMARAYAWHEKMSGPWQSLTNRERQVLRLLAQGLSNVSIAERFDVKAKTAAFHVTNILRKLEVSSRLEAVTWMHSYLPEEPQASAPRDDFKEFLGHNW